jgi:hypothetical protein
LDLLRDTSLVHRGSNTSSVAEFRAAYTALREVRLSEAICAFANDMPGYGGEVVLT